MNIEMKGHLEKIKKFLAGEHCFLFRLNWSQLELDQLFFGNIHSNTIHGRDDSSYRLLSFLSPVTT